MDDGGHEVSGPPLRPFFSIITIAGRQKTRHTAGNRRRIKGANYFALSPYSIPPEYKNAVYLTGSCDSVTRLSRRLSRWASQKPRSLLPSRLHAGHALVAELRVREVELAPSGCIARP
jgi:hypothetical protein